MQAGNTALHFAAAKGKLKIFKVLLEKLKGDEKATLILKGNNVGDHRSRGKQSCTATLCGPFSL